MIYYLTRENAAAISSTEMAELEKAIAISVDTKWAPAWRYMKEHTSFKKQSHALSSSNTSGGSSTSGSSTSSSTSQSKSLVNNLNWVGSIAGHAQGWVSQAAESFKNFLPENKKLWLTRVTDAICELRPHSEDESYVYLDPKIKAGGNSNQVPRQRTPFRHVIVFVIGGGNYHEYQNLQAYAKVLHAMPISLYLYIRRSPTFLSVVNPVFCTS
jgi:hypothetical protein